MIGEFHGALADNAILEAPGAFDFEFGAMAERRGGACKTGFEPGEQFVVAVIERDFGREAVALRDQLQALVGRDRIGVGAQGKEVAGGFDRREAGAWHQDGPGGGEAFDGGTHGAFELEHGGGGRLAWVDSFGVLDQGQRERASVFRQCGEEVGNAQPEAVGVEVAVTVDVLKGFEVVGGALGNFAQNQAAVAAAAGEVSAFAIRGRALGDFHEEGQSACGEVAEERGIDRGAEVVAVGDKEVFDAGVGEALQPTRSEQRGVKIPVAGGAPFEVGVFRPSHGFEGVGAELRDFVLQEVERTVGREVGVACEVAERVGGRAEAIHEQEARTRRAVGAAQPEDLAGDEVEKGEAVFDWNEGLGFFQAHTGAESAVQLDQAKLVEQGGIGRDPRDVG